MTLDSSTAADGGGDPRLQLSDTVAEAAGAEFAHGRIGDDARTACSVVAVCDDREWRLAGVSA
jgi:hypothetical protein